MATKNKEGRSRALAGGAIAGIIGGLALSALMVGLTLWRGGDIWPVLKGSAAPFLGERVAQPGFDLFPVVLGLMVHFAISVGWGVLFGLFFYGMRRGPTVIAGVLWGVVVWLLMFYLVLPLAGLGAVVKGVPTYLAVLQHAFFGLFVGLGFLPFQRPLKRTPPLPRREPVHP